jgi:hypothetical protein
VIQRAFRWWQWRRRLLARAKTLAQMHSLAIKRQKLAVAAAVFRDAEQSAREQRQRQLQREHGAKLEALTRVRRRQQQVRALASSSLPALPAVRRRNGVEDGRAETGWDAAYTSRPLRETLPLLRKGPEKPR